MVKSAMKAFWAEGDWGEMARDHLPAAAALVRACSIQPGEQVLDVATGTGNVAVCAANRDARVVGSDLCFKLLDKARSRSHREALPITWSASDMDALPFAEESFDHALSAFGVSFAPSADGAVRELFRVTRRGGTVGIVNWAGVVWAMRVGAALRRHIDAPPRDDWARWTNEGGAQERLLDHAKIVHTEMVMLWIELHSGEAWWARAERCSPLIIGARRRLPPRSLRRAESRTCRSGGRNGGTPWRRRAAGEQVHDRGRSQMKLLTQASRTLGNSA